MAVPEAVMGIRGPRIIALAASHRLPAVYAYAAQVNQGGLAADTTSVVQDVERSAKDIDRILHGAPVGSLPLQAAARFETIIALKTAAALRLANGPSLMARADELIAERRLRGFSAPRRRPIRAGGPQPKAGSRPSGE
ncbi:hypothetical protein MKK75_31165 [Methylobacterium sp. J-030]|uniref:ABC transporter substrate binding protein n=1 Tax=Methylobacterium sp. J-030 TaxID=2836627 RepID=UPI001FB8D2B6|nr:ABC transporter substrate binding protein [Methylobacterium sp. J-030]MCJ2073194.1 hypothetical protein [Methylobacterium sp. J-030]